MLTKRDMMRGTFGAALVACVPAIPAQAAGIGDFSTTCRRLDRFVIAVREASPTLRRQVVDFLRNPRPVDLVLSGEYDSQALCKMFLEAKLLPLAIFDFIKASPGSEDIEAIRLVPAPYNEPWPTPHLRDSRVERLV